MAAGKERWRAKGGLGRHVGADWMAVLYCLQDVRLVCAMGAAPGAAPRRAVLAGAAGTWLVRRFAA